MCGISVVCGSGAAPSILDRLHAMHGRIGHRGPDGEGWLAVDLEWTTTVAPTEEALRHAVGERPLRIGAAFRWLQIQDLDPSSCQPMASQSGETWVLFNGQIYNHDALRQELASRGRTFRTRSDTEVLLAAYEHWGSGCFERLNGMWGAVIIDTRRRSIVVSRDRFGIRPLFYRLDENRLLLGSEAKQLVSLAGERPMANRHAVLGFLVGRRLDCDETYFDGVRAVPAATRGTIALADGPPLLPDFVPYWTVAQRRSGPAGDSLGLEEASIRLEELLQDSVALQSAAAVPVGALLSGGLDSSITSTFLVEARRRRHQPSWLISVTPENVGDALDERPYMRTMAKALGGDDVTAIESPIDGAWIDATMDKTTWHQEEPVAGIALIVNFRAYHAAAEHGVRVVLEGTGSDELFAGYPRHQLARIREYLRRRRWWQAAREFASAWHADQVFGPWFLDSTNAWFLRRARRLTSRPAAPVWMHGSVPPPRSSGRLPSPGGTRASALARISAGDVTRGNVPAVLAVSDRNAMAHSVETRVPFLDHRVVEFAFSLPDDFKTARGSRKIVLREVARRRLPAAVAERRARIGFGVPLAEWMRQSLRTSLLDAVHGSAVASGEVFETAATQRFVAQFLDGRHEDVASVWRIFAVARWQQSYSVTT